MIDTSTRVGLVLGATVLLGSSAAAQSSITVDLSPAGRRQIIDGFGTALNDQAREPWFQELYLDDLRSSIARMDVTPRFRPPYSDLGYYSPAFGGPLMLPGPDGNNVRAYKSALDYERPFGGFRPRIAVMGPDIEQNITLFDYDDHRPASAGALVTAARARGAELKLLGTIFSPAPWLKVASGNTFSENQPNFPFINTPYPFIWNGNFSGGYLDVSNAPLPVFHDGVSPTSALTQYARSTAAYLLGFQRRYGAPFYAVSIQNELNFEQFYDSCSYPLTSQFAAAVKALRAELDRHPELAAIQIIGPEDLIIDSPYSFWQFGGSSNPTHKNLRYMHEMQLTDRAALGAIGFFAVHGEPSERAWGFWVNGWSATPEGKLPSSLAGFASYGKKSWMTETSGQQPVWPTPGVDKPEHGALHVAINIHRALTTGVESAWLHWQLSEGTVGTFSLTDREQGVVAPKYVAAKHFFRLIRPNAQRVEATSSVPTVLASAYAHEADRTVTIVLINTGNTDQRAPIAVQGIKDRLANLRSYTSSPSLRWQEGTVSPDQIEVNVPAYGVVTLHGRRVPDPATVARVRLYPAGTL